MQPLWQHIGRWVMTLGLLIGVYSETGPFTTLAVALIFFTLEFLYARLVRRIHHAKEPQHQG